MADNDYRLDTYDGGILSGWSPRGWSLESSGLNFITGSRTVPDIDLASGNFGLPGNMAWDQDWTGSTGRRNADRSAFSQDGRTYVRGDGDVVEERSGGTRAWRNNNPGNIEAGSFANYQGAIGSDGRFAIFPSQETGRGAIVSLLNSPAYQRLTLQQAISRYAPPVENDTAAYSNYVSGAGSLPLDTRLNAMTPQQIDALARAIQVHEGWRPGTSTRSIWNIHLGD